MLHTTASRLLLILIALALPCTAASSAVQLPDGQDLESPTSTASAEPERHNSAKQEAETVKRAIDARNEQVLANLDAVREVIKSKASGSEVGDVLREARQRAPVLADLENNVRLRERLLAEARVQKVRLLERQRFAENLDEQRELAQQLEAHEDSVQALVDALESAKQLAVNSQELIEYLDGHLLWLRSADPMGASGLSDVAQGAAWLVRPQSWSKVWSTLQTRATDHSFLTTLAALALLTLIAVRNRVRKSLPELASAVGRVSTDSFMLTVRALIDTLLLSLPMPMALIAVGVLLDSNEHAASVRSISRGFLAAGSVYLLLDFARQLCRNNGLADVHFRWNERARKVLRSNLRWLTILEVVSAFVVATCDASELDLYRLNLGRLAFIAGTLGLSGFLMVVFRPSTGVLAELLAREGLVWRLRKLWYAALVAVHRSVSQSLQRSASTTPLRRCRAASS